MRTSHFTSAGCLAAALILTANTAFAVPITGAIGFTGPYVANSSNLTAATSITYSNAAPTQIVTDGLSSGSFAGIAMGTPVTVFTPLIINQPGIILPGGPIWSVGGFSLFLSSAIELFNNTNTFVVEAVGTLTSTIPGFDATPGTWVATFNNATSGTFTNFTFSASSAALPVSVPEGGSSAALVALAGLGLTCCLCRLSARADGQLTT